MWCSCDVFSAIEVAPWWQLTTIIQLR